MFNVAVNLMLNVTVKLITVVEVAFCLNFVILAAF